MIAKQHLARATAKLRCGVYGEGSVISIDVKRNADVEALQEAIFAMKRYSARYKFNANDLTLYLAREEGGPWLSGSQNVEDLQRGDIDTRFKQMIPWWKLDKEELFGSDFILGDEEIHVLVERPEAQQSAAMLAHLMPPVDQGWIARWLREYHMSQVAPQSLPLLGDLAECIEHELPVKIALHEQIRDNWMAKMKTPSSELMAKIFRVANSELCVEFMNQVGYRVVQPRVDPGDTKTSFISFWDDLIYYVLNFVGIGKSDRSPSPSVSTGPNRPDYLFLVDSVCVFRGKEKAPGEQMETLRCEFF